ncbi:MAG: peptidoglycan DD-metalloendopeptidase family protein [Rhodocyclaceae bacterium]|nr:peptidoglycan DD-metalloendopeptidase family protein [Rhodocyclaceae bacterium]
MIRVRDFWWAVFLAVLGGCASPGPAPVADRGNVIVRAPEVAPPSPQPAKRAVHVVRPGETLNAIGRQYGVATKDLVAWNGLVDPNQITVGQELKLAPGDGVVVKPVIASEGGEGRAVAPAIPSQAVKDGPKGGKILYSEQALAQARSEGQASTKVEATGAASPAVAPPVNPAPTTPDAEGDWLWPANGKVISGFADGAGKGVDIAGKLGDPVLATAAGKVVYAGSGLRGYGKLVIIKHDDSFLSAYAHNRLLLVNEGQSVAKGQKIAEMGSTDTDRPKLHFEIRRQGKPVDPLKYLPNR